MNIYLSNRLRAVARVGMGSVLTAAALLMFEGNLSAQAGQPQGAVFAATNNATRNDIVMYNRAGNGRLSLVGRFPTGGRGEGGVDDPMHSQSSLILSPDHTYLLAVNAGSSDISVFRVINSGLLLLSVTPSGGSSPVSLAMHDNLVYVVNYAGDYHIAGFRLESWGGLTPVRDSKQTLSSGADLGASTVAFSPDGSKLVVTERITNKIDVFTVNGDGSLSNPVYNNSVGPEPFSIIFTLNGMLLVTEANNGLPSGSSTSSYTINADNTLNAISSQVSASGIAACWIASNGAYAWVSDTRSGTIGAYTVGTDGTLTSIGSAAQQAAPPGANLATSFPLDLALSNDNQYLYVFFSTRGEIVGYKVGDNGQLQQITSALPEKPSVGAEGLAAY